VRKVEISSYNEKWVSMFEEEADKLRDIFGEEVLVIHHIGSTSVPGLKAKPIIDVMPVVKEINEVDKYNKAMQNIGYEPKGENGIPERRYFQKGGDNRTHHVHIYQLGNYEIERHLAFRDYLRTHPDSIKNYGELKQQLAHQFPHNIESYIDGKNNLVADIERRAIDWYKKNQKSD
jgi:GrpB-like predicted nucleotidyltransferase (UPF0157 family)